MSEKQETVDDIIAEARDKYTVHECNQCAWRKCCSKGFGSEECGKFRESIWLKLGIEDGYFTQLLDRLEAAHKREKSAIEADALAVGGIVEAKRKRESEESKHREEVKSLQATIKKLNDALTEQNGERGNSAALREALKAAELGLFRLQSGSISRDEHRELVATIKTALAAPPRNCDIYLTEEAVDAATVTVRDCEACSRIDMEAPCVFCMVRWLLALAKEGGAK